MNNPTTPAQALAAKLAAAGRDVESGQHDRLIDAYGREAGLSALGMDDAGLTASIDAELGRLGLSRPVSEPTV